MLLEFFLIFVGFHMIMRRKHFKGPSRFLKLRKPSFN